MQVAIFLKWLILLNLHKGRKKQSILFKFKGQMTVKQFSANTSYQNSTGNLIRYYKSRSTTLGHLRNKPSSAVQKVKSLSSQTPGHLQMTSLLTTGQSKFPNHRRVATKKF